MSAFKGTPGPWAVNPISAQVDAMPSLLPVCQLLWPTDQRSEAETEANARLIAAAPELLEALKALFDRANHHTCTEIGGWFTGNDENFETLRKAEQAIAKATGERP